MFFYQAETLDIAVIGAGHAGIEAALAAALHMEEGRPIFVLCADEAECDRVCRDLASLTGEEPLRLGGRDFVFDQTEAAPRQWQQKRLAALWAMARGEAPIVVSTPDARSILIQPFDPSTLNDIKKAIAESKLNLNLCLFTACACESAGICFLLDFVKS